MKPYYSDDLVTLYHGDCREATRWLGADALVIDPPYGRGWRQGRIEGRGNGRRPSDASASHDGIANDGETAVRDHVLNLWVGRRAIVFGDLMLAPPVDTAQVLAYRKPSSAGVRGATAGHRRDIEAIYLVGPWPSGIGGRTSVIDAGYANVATGPAAQTGHPHAKSLAVMEYLCSLTEGVIADTFAGSGSTLIAAKALGRNAIGYELDERYCEIAAKRLAQDTLFGGVA